MARVYVVRSRVGWTLQFGDRSIRPWCTVEVPVESMVGELRREVEQAKLERLVDVHLVIDGKPVAAYNEAVVLNTPAQVREHVPAPTGDQASLVPGQVKIEESQS